MFSMLKLKELNLSNMFFPKILYLDETFFFFFFLRYVTFSVLSFLRISFRKGFSALESGVEKMQF